MSRAAWTATVTVRAPIEARFPFRPWAAIEQVQSRRVAAIVAHAYEHVPYYRETMARLGLTPADIATAGDLRRLPVIEREELQRDPEYFLARDQPRDAHLELRTSGSTGQPIVYWRDHAALRQRLCAFQRMEPILASLTGKRFRRRYALVAPPSSSTTDTNRTTRHRVLPPVRTVGRSFSLFADPSELADEIVAFRPDVVSGYGSAIEALFAELLARPEPGHLPGVAIYAADLLDEPMRAAIEAAGVRVLSVYQAVETPTIGFECDHHRGHHLNADMCVVRILDDDGRDAAVGERGSVVTSNLVTRGTVLLNYRLGDVAARLPEPCPCGRTLPLLSGIEGRVNDWLQAADGDRVHPQTVRSILRMSPEILRFQLVQGEPGRFVVRAVTTPGADRAAIREAVHAGMAEFAGRLAVEVEFTDTLPRSKGGKVRSVVPS